MVDNSEPTPQVHYHARDYEVKLIPLVPWRSECLIESDEVLFTLHRLKGCGKLTFGHLPPSGGRLTHTYSWFCDCTGMRKPILSIVMNYTKQDGEGRWQRAD